MNASNYTRRGTALILSSIVVITIAGLSIALTNLTIGRFGEQKARQTEVDLLAATESAANEAISWMKVSPEAQDLLGRMAISTKVGFPDSKYSTSSVMVSTRLPNGAPEMYPTLVGKSGGSSGANGSGLRNGCTVETKIIKVASSATPSVWDGSERFIIYTTATAGDPSRPDTIRRQRVESVIEAVSKTVSKVTKTSVPTPAFPFTRGLFSVNGYDFKGTAETDSWKSDSDGNGIADTPYKRPASYTVGGPNSNGDVGSNGVLGSGAYDTSKVHGEATANAGATLPNVTYIPPTTGYTALSSITNNATISGSGAGTTVYRVPSIDQGNNKSLTISGTGTVVIYVDGVFNVGDVKFAAGSTAKLIIYQNDVSGRGCSFNAQNTVGDPNDPGRFLFVSAFSGTGSNEMKLNGGANFSAVVLAPNAGIKFNGGSNFFGSFVGKDFSGAINGTFNFHYDESLAGKSWGTIMTEITTETKVPVLETMSPITWNVRSLAYGTP